MCDSSTFGWVDVDTGAIEGFLGEPIVVAPDGAGGVDGEQCQQNAAEDGAGGPGRAVARDDVIDDVTAPGHQQAVAHGGDVEHALGHHETDVKEEIGGRDEGQHHHRHGQDQEVAAVHGGRLPLRPARRRRRPPPLRFQGTGRAAGRAAAAAAAAAAAVAAAAAAAAGFARGRAH